MRLFKFPNNREREQGPSRLERTVLTLCDHICAIQADGGEGISGFTTESKKISDSVAEISVTRLMTTGNQVGLGRAELQPICDLLNNHLRIDARPFTVSILETRDTIPSTPDDDFTQNAHFTLQVRAQDNI